MGIPAIAPRQRQTGLAACSPPGDMRTLSLARWRSFCRRRCKVKIHHFPRDIWFIYDLIWFSDIFWQKMIYIYIYVCFNFVHISLSAIIYVCFNLYHVCICLCIHIHIYIYMYVYVCVYIYISISTLMLIRVPPWLLSCAVLSRKMGDNHPKERGWFRRQKSLHMFTYSIAWPQRPMYDILHVTCSNCFCAFSKWKSKPSTLW